MRAVLSRFNGLIALAAANLAIAAQFTRSMQQAEGAAALLFVFALAAWLVALMLHHAPLIETTASSADDSRKESRRETSRAFVASAALLAVLTFVTATENAFTPDNVLSWLLSVALLLYAFWEPEKDAAQWRAWLRERLASLRGEARGIRIAPNLLLVAGVVALGAFFFYSNLGGVPAEMDSDHAEKILDVNNVLVGARPIYFERGTGREPLDFYLTAAFVGLGKRPLDFGALKFVGATIGLLTVLAIFFLARELFDFDVALAAAALAAMSKWLVALARLGLRYVFAPLLIAALFYFLMRALKYRRRNDFLIAGLFLGLSFYGFEPLRFALPLAVLFLLLGSVFFSDAARPSAFIKNGILSLAVALFAAMPLARYAVDQPAVFWHHAQTRLLAVGQSFAGNPILTFANNLGAAMTMFNWAGDEAWVAGIPGDPALDYATGGLFFLGVVLAFYRLMRFRERMCWFVLTGLVVMLLPSALNLAFPNENPSAVFASGAIPFAMILAALPVIWIARALDQSFRDVAWGRVVSVGFIALVIALGSRANYLRYFQDYDAFYRGAAWNSSEIASAIRAFAESVGDTGHAWLIAYPYWVDARNVGIGIGQIGWEQVLPHAEAARANADQDANRLYILHSEDQANLLRFKNIYPNGQARVFYSRTPGRDFVLFFVPGTIAPSVPLNAP